MKIPDIINLYEERFVWLSFRGYSPRSGGPTALSSGGGVGWEQGELWWRKSTVKG